MDETVVVRNVGRYQVLSELGRGTMGVVSKGYDPTIRRTVALKTIAFAEQDEESREFRRRLYGEAAAAGALKHPNIVTIYDVIEDGPTTAIAMEFIEGSPLSSILRKEGPLDVDHALSLFEPICAALDHAGSKGIIHRDIKPANIIVDADGSPKITDFGIAKMPASSTRTGIIMGSPGYMSPEQVRGQVLDRRSDLFSAAALFYEMIASDRPFEGEDTGALLYRIVHERHRPVRQLNPRITPALAAVLDRALAKNPDDRFATGAELVAAMRAAMARPAAPATLMLRPAGEEGAHGPTDSAINRALDAELARSPKRNAWLLAGAAAVIAAGIVSAVLLRGRLQNTGEAPTGVLAAAPASPSAPGPGPTSVSAPTAATPSPAPPIEEAKPTPVSTATGTTAVRADANTAPAGPTGTTGTTGATGATPPRPAGGLDVTYSSAPYPVVLYGGSRQLGRLETGGFLRLAPGDVRIRAVAESVFLDQDLGSLSLRAGERKPLALPGVASAVLSVRGDAYAGLRIEIDERPIDRPYPAQVPRIAAGAHVVRFLWATGPMAGKDLTRSFDARAQGHFLIRAQPEDGEIAIQRVR